MRKYIKKQLVEIINTLVNAERVLRKLIVKQDNDSINILLQDMQTAAIEVGETIDKYQENEETVHLLEEVCEVLWEISQKQTDEKSRLCNVLHKKMEVVRKQVSVFSEETEIVFLPYKASMWTSLESIWKAANQDELCHAVVVPIPYFDLDANGNKIKLNYEGDMFPPEVPIINYQEINLEELHPEVIYYHNPYDEYNNLTRVPEYFYAKNLRNYTECMVYSPYALESRTSVREMYQLMLPGYRYADKVIVQNKKMAVLCKKAGMPEEKLLVYGSPKLDAICIKEKDIVWKWEKESEFQDKKILLLNIHLCYLTKKDEVLHQAHLKVINRILDLVEEREELALIVRPHPLIKAWITKAYPQRMVEYEKIEKRIQSSSKCILDESGSYLEAFALSVAMISTFSSLITEYMVTNKPILILQNSPNEEQMKCDVVSYAGNYFTTDENSKLLMPLVEFIDMVRENKDPLASVREQIVREDLGSNIGHIGEKIHYKIKEQL